MDFITAIRTCFEKYGDFSGRARRSEYWWFHLFLLVASIVVGYLDDVIGVPLVGGLFTLAMLVPILAAGARRLHDTNRSGWWQAVVLLPLLVAFAGGLWSSQILVWTGVVFSLAAITQQIVWKATNSMPGDNRYGPPAK